MNGGQRVELLQVAMPLAKEVLPHDAVPGRSSAGVLLLMALDGLHLLAGEVFASQREKPRLDYLLERKEQLDENLRDLNFEFSAGKYPEEEFQTQRAQLENEADTAQIEAEIEQLRQA
jgi:hypothetical protein